MAWSDLGGDRLVYEPSELESRRFSRRIGRLVVGHHASTLHDLPELLARIDDDVTVVRYPAHRGEIAASLAACGRVVIPAGALTYWGVDADLLAKIETSVEHEAVGRPETVDSVMQVAVRLAFSREEAADVVARIVADSFAAYPNHYAANPLLSPVAALEGYVEWAVSALDRHDGRDVLLFAHGGPPVGVATLHADDGSGDLEILLAGLVHKWQGHGLYRRILTSVGEEAVARGLGRVIISTQVHNTRAQRAWARTGFLPFAAFETVHLVRPGLLAMAPQHKG